MSTSWLLCRIRTSTLTPSHTVQSHARGLLHTHISNSFHTICRQTPFPPTSSLNSSTRPFPSLCTTAFRSTHHLNHPRPQLFHTSHHPLAPKRPAPEEEVDEDEEEELEEDEEEYVEEEDGVSEYETAPDAKKSTTGRGKSASAGGWAGRSPSAGFGSTGAPVLRPKRPARGPSLLESQTTPDMTGITIVQNPTDLQRVLTILQSPSVRTRFHAVDTEVMDIDVRNQSPVGHGRVTCISIYAGPDVDFGSGPKLWIDTLDQVDPVTGEIKLNTGEEMMQALKPYLEDPTILKVWHNYSFDRHVLSNHGIHCRGFGGDTMHMARLENAARDKYALEVLSEDFLGIRKRPMKELFSRPKPKKDGTLGKVQELPPVEEIQRDAAFLRPHWIGYSTYDTQSTWEIREVLEKRLKKVEWLPPTTNSSAEVDDSINHAHQTKSLPEPGRSLFDFYLKYWRPFGELLCDMESIGIWVDAKEFLPKVELAAEKDKERYVETFREWAKNQQAEACDMNIHSAVQKQHFFFAGRGVPRKFQVENTEGWVDPNSKNGKPKKKRDFLLYGLGMPITETTAKKMPAVSLKVLKKLAGKLEVEEAGVTPKYGTAYQFFNKTQPDQAPQAGKEACHAIDALCKVSAVNIMLNTFIKPLQEQTDSAGRIHCSLNLNTETGRLSSRKPNLQNQPALEKDIYKIRQAFAAVPGKKLIVADYGQLELRILAHIANCRSMIEAFELGGDFHSRTAMGMYPHVSSAVANNEVLLEWDKTKNGGAKPPLPILKDVFAAERRKAKTLNFSIAYGKTARGLAQDWNVSLDEANATLEAWYRDRPEVREWQMNTIKDAHDFLCTRTLMGRYRPLPFINSKIQYESKHSERAAINTPIQGGAADVVMKAMLLLHEHTRFRELGWRILLQIHDEIIAEGPQESAEEALEIVKHTMANPFKRPLRVELVVDAKIGNTWYESK